MMAGIQDVRCCTYRGAGGLLNLSFDLPFATFDGSLILLDIYVTILFLWIVHYCYLTFWRLFLRMVALSYDALIVCFLTCLLLLVQLLILRVGLSITFLLLLLVHDNL